jgi:hypothetical protein
MIAFNPDGQWLFRLFPNLPAKLHIPILGFQLYHRSGRCIQQADMGWTRRPFAFHSRRHLRSSAQGDVNGLLTNVAMRDIGIAINREADESLNKATPPKAQGQAGIVALR